MSENLRKHPRDDIQVEVALNFLEDDSRTVITRDISNGGLFMRLSNSEHYTMGEIVSVSYKDPKDNFTDTSKDAVIVRQTDEGIAIAFIEMGDF